MFAQAMIAAKWLEWLQCGRDQLIAECRASPVPSIGHPRGFNVAAIS